MDEERLKKSFSIFAPHQCLDAMKVLKGRIRCIAMSYLILSLRRNAFELLPTDSEFSKAKGAKLIP